MHYDSNGMRTQKGNVYYYYNSDNNLIGMVSGANTLLFYYDGNGNATAFSLNGNMYFYVKNLQGDIINIVDTNGTVVVRYNYDIFGAITAVKNGSNQTITDTTSIAFLNPLRYRGYVYDDETGLYYLQSRYYDAVTGRFLNADVYFDTCSGSPLSTNMFAYCENNYLYREDKNGRDAAWIQAPSSVGFIVGSFGHTSALFEDSNSGWWYFYWGPESVQMLFLGAFSKNYLNEHIKRIINVFNKIYSGLNIKHTDVYTDGLRFKGIFYSSIESILYFFKVNNYYSHKYIYKLRFNPDISDEKYKRLH